MKLSTDEKIRTSTSNTLCLLAYPGYMTQEKCRRNLCMPGLQHERWELQQVVKTDTVSKITN